MSGVIESGCFMDIGIVDHVDIWEGERFQVFKILVAGDLSFRESLSQSRDFSKDYAQIEVTTYQWNAN